MKKRFAIATAIAELTLGIMTLAVNAQDINVRLSVKFVLGPNGVVPSGVWSDISHWHDAVDLANEGNVRLGRGFHYLYPTFDGNISGFEQYHKLHNGEEIPFEYAVRTNPQQSGWRNDAINIYVVSENLGTPSQPACAGWASNPEDPLSPNLPYSALNGRVVVFCVDMQPSANPFGIMPHEFGHHMGLIHTWANDRVADTPVDADPTVCEQSGVPDWCDCKFANTLAKAAAENWSQSLLNVMTNNLMSYHCGYDNDFDLTEGQLDRWADIARRYLASEMTGVTYFVDRNNFLPFSNGYSTNPYHTVQDGVSVASSKPGNIVMVRHGNYNEQLTVSKSVTLRTPRNGSAVIGSP